MGLGLFSFVIESVVEILVFVIKWFDSNTNSVKHTVGDNADDTTFIDYIVKWVEGNTNSVKHIVTDNDDGTVTVITQVIYKGNIVHVCNETAKSRFLDEMKKDHKRDGKEFLRKYKAT